MGGNPYNVANGGNQMNPSAFFNEPEEQVTTTTKTTKIIGTQPNGV